MSFIIVPFFILIAGIYLLIKGYRPARFFVIAFLALLVTSTIRAMMIYGLLPTISIINYINLIGISLQFTLLSFALADRINILKKEIGNVKNKTILDIGCGGGRNSIPLAKMGAKVTGVDISPQMLDFAKNNSKKNKCSKNTNFILSSAWETNLPSKSFDKILLLGILEHIPEEYRKKTIKEIIFNNKIMNNK